MTSLHNILADHFDALEGPYKVDEPPNGFYYSIYALEMAKRAAKTFEANRSLFRVDSIYGFEWYDVNRDCYMCMYGFHADGVDVNPVIEQIPRETSRGT